MPDTSPTSDPSARGDALRAEVAQGRRADQRLAADIGRVPAGTPHPDDGYFAGLDSAVAPIPTALVRDARGGDAAARARLVEALMPQISAAARSYRTTGVERQELLQEGVVGVLRALERYDPDRGVPFWGYATWWVRHAMQQLVSELSRPLVLSDRALRHLSQLKQAHQASWQATGREPSRQELITESGLAAEHVDALLAAERPPRSLDEPRGDPDQDLGTFGELLVDPLAQDAYEDVLHAIEIDELRDLLSGLSDRERHVLRLRYAQDGPRLSLRRVGTELGLSAERISQIEHRALAKLAEGSPATTG